MKSSAKSLQSPPADIHSLPPWLTPFIAERWHAASADGIEHHLILPDNCMDLIVEQGRWCVVGAATTAFTATVVPGRPLQGMRFKPGVLPILLGVDARALLDSRQALEDVEPMCTETWRRRLDRAETDGRLRMLAGLARSDARRVSDLARELGHSARHLRRRLTPLLGYSSVQWLRIRRIQALVKRGSQHEDLAALALLIGFSDQAHMNRECRIWTGMTPRELRDHPPTGVHSSINTPFKSRT
ncbi:MAG: helix-turn-helix transcriptional regulator [Myxococcota bacterium]